MSLGAAPGDDDEEVGRVRKDAQRMADEQQQPERRYATAAEITEAAAEIERMVGRWPRFPQVCAGRRPTRADDHGWARAFAAARIQEHQ